MKVYLYRLTQIIINALIYLTYKWIDFEPYQVHEYSMYIICGTPVDRMQTEMKIFSLLLSKRA